MNRQLSVNGVKYEQLCQFSMCHTGERLEIERIPSDGRIVGSIEEAESLGWVKRQEPTDREFLEYIDNQLSGLIRHVRYLRHRVQSQLGWTDPEDAWMAATGPTFTDAWPQDTDETP